MGKLDSLQWPKGVCTQEGESRQAVAAALADEVADALVEAQKLKGSVILVVSGGSTPIPFFDALSHKSLDWPAVHVVLADERCVDTTHPDSNEALVRRHLLTNEAVGARLLSLYRGQDGAEAHEDSAVQRDLARLPWPADAVVLGMGTDGHTASLFPGAERLKYAMAASEERYIESLMPLTAPHRRLTLTAPVLQEAVHLWLHLAGMDKIATLEKVLAEPARVSEMPVRAFLRPGLKVFWSE